MFHFHCDHNISEDVVGTTHNGLQRTTFCTYQCCKCMRKSVEPYRGACV